MLREKLENLLFFMLSELNTCILLSFGLLIQRDKRIIGLEHFNAMKEFLESSMELEIPFLEVL